MESLSLLAIAAELEDLPMLIYLAAMDASEDRSKFETVYLRYRGLMYHVAYKILKNEQDAEDAVHNAFLEIAENIEKISHPECPKTRSYVVTIVESKAIDLYRKNQRRKDEAYLDELQGLPVQEARGLEGCILRLPARYREVILLKYYHGFSGREIAQQLGISEANAAKLVQRAKQKLQELCEKEGVL